MEHRATKKGGAALAKVRPNAVVRYRPWHSPVRIAQHVAQVLCVAVPCVALVSPNLSPTVDVTGQIGLSSGRPASNAVIQLENGTRNNPPEKVTVRLSGQWFEPHVTFAPVGSQLSIRALSAPSGSIRLDREGWQKSLRADSVRLEKPGVTTVLSDRHPWASAYVVATESPYVAICDTHGRFEIEDVPPGRYDAVIWHESGERIRTQVIVADGVPIREVTQPSAQRLTISK